ncbi:MAG: TonB-dependent receptor [Desulfurella sp.]|uniref:TonB-dependent receptor n=1 Tax=Desulfurella sp. TaxID=1962857 RepID=UPI003C77FA91
MKRLWLVCLFLTILSNYAFADDSKKLEAVNISATPIVEPTKQTEQTVFSGLEVTKQGMDLGGTQAQTSVYNAINILPDVSIENADSSGLYAEGTNVRIRGVRGYLGAMTVEGIPNYGGNPMGPRDYIYNMQNFKAIKVYESAMPASLGVGVGNRGGAIELVPLWPLKTTQFKMQQTYGSYELYENFFRFDSGNIDKTNTRFSVSYSYGIANKWRGPGEIGPRNNVNFMLDQPVGDVFDAKVFFNYNFVKQNLYRALTYAQIDDTNLDYNSSKTSVASKDINYFGYNHGDFQNTDFFSILTIKPTNIFDVVLKPYYSKENTRIWQGISPQNIVQKRTRDIDRKGIIAQFDLNVNHFKVSSGMQYEVSNMDIYSQNYAILGDNLSYRGYGVFATTGDSYIKSPFLQVAFEDQKFKAQAGIKYFRFNDSASQGYVTSKTAPYSLVRAPDLDRKERLYDIWLPNVGLSYKFSDEFELYANYGRNFIRPYAYMPLINLYNSNRQAFQKAHITLNDLFDGYNIERSDNIDLGARIRGSWFDLLPTFFYSKQKDLLTTVYDPRVKLNYQQNIGKATGYGFELAFNAYVNDYLTFFFNPSFTRLTYDNDISYQGSLIGCKDKQIVDVPKWLIKSGFIVNYDKWQFIPSVIYVGSRYADAGHTQEVASYATLNAQINYTLKNIYKMHELKLSLQLNNILNKKYIAVINSMDDALAGNTSFYPGEPFNASLTASLTF